MVRIKSRWMLINVYFGDQDDSAGLTSRGITANSTTATSQLAPPLQVQLLRLLRDAVQLAFGDVGSGTLGGSLAVRYYSPSTHNAIVRCSRLALPYVWAAATLCDEFAGRKARLTVTHCGGTIRKVQQAAIRADRRAIERLCVQRKRLAKLAAVKATLALQVETAAPEGMSEQEQQPVVLDEQAQRALVQSRRDISQIEF